MTTILDLAKEPYPMTTEQKPAEPTEKAQIVIAYISPQPPLVVRFSTLKKGEQVYAKLVKAWAEYHKKPAFPIFHIGADMFVATVNLAQIGSISFVDHKKRSKFIPA